MEIGRRSLVRMLDVVEPADGARPCGICVPRRQTDDWALRTAGEVIGGASSRGRLRHRRASLPSLDARIPRGVLRQRGTAARGRRLRRGDWKSAMGHAARRRLGEDVRSTLRRLSPSRRGAHQPIPDVRRARPDVDEARRPNRPRAAGGLRHRSHISAIAAHAPEPHEHRRHQRLRQSARHLSHSQKRSLSDLHVDRGKGHAPHRLPFRHRRSGRARDHSR